MDIPWIRSQFPSLDLQVAGRPAVFFDGPGGTQVPRRVVEAMSDYLLHANANTVGAFETSRRTDRMLIEAHAAMADFLNCAPEEVVFGANMTTLTFAASRAIARDLRPGDEIVVTRLDHDANVSPWVALEEQGVVVRRADIHTEDCTLDMDDLRAKVTPRTRLVAVGYAANAVGTINDVAEIVRMAHAAGAWAWIDAVHYAPHGSIDVGALDCDFLVCSPYKFFGPHAGVMFGKRALLERLRPYKLRASTEALPARWETGTLCHEVLAGVTGAVDYLAELGRRASPARESRRERLAAAYNVIRAYERSLAGPLICGLHEIPGLTFYGIREPARFEWRCPTVAVTVRGHTPLELATRLGERGIFTWDGNYYALDLTERLGVEANGGLLRLGLVHYNTREEVERVLEELRSIAVT